MSSPAPSFRFDFRRADLGRAARTVAKSAKSEDPKQQFSRKLKDALDRVPTMMGRLMRVADALNRQQRQYRSVGLDPNCTEAEFCALMHRMHRRLIVSWLAQTMENRVADMALWFLSEGRQGLLRRLHDGKGFDDLLPLEIAEETRERFLIEVRVAATLVVMRAGSRICKI